MKVNNCMGIHNIQFVKYAIVAAIASCLAIGTAAEDEIVEKTVTSAKTCSKCKGKGWFWDYRTCQTCSGRGTIPVENNLTTTKTRFKPCPTCAARVGSTKGKVRHKTNCPECSGAGRIKSTKTVRVDMTELKRNREAAENERKARIRSVMSENIWRFFIVGKYEGFSTTYSDVKRLSEWSEKDGELTSAPSVRIVFMNSYDYLKLKKDLGTENFLEFQSLAEIRRYASKNKRSITELVKNANFKDIDHRSAKLKKDKRED